MDDAFWGNYFPGIRWGWFVYSVTCSGGLGADYHAAVQVQKAVTAYFTS